MFFSNYESPLKKYGIKEQVRETGAGVYEVSHAEDTITADLSEEQKNNLKMIEYRYAGQSVDNFVAFNNELWRLIGLVNTPEGYRLKLIRNENIGEYSWDSSESSVNAGWGINSWKDADAMKLLNNGGYYNRMIDTCYNDKYNTTISCDFRNNGLTSQAKEMIDTITWNIGAGESWTSFHTSEFYEAERSNNSSKICTSSNHCNDTVSRSTLWVGQVGLIYPSDYGYATSGRNKAGREFCLSNALRDWHNYRECFLNNWLFDTDYYWSLFPVAFPGSADTTVFISCGGAIGNTASAGGISLRPVIYLKKEIIITSGNGTKENPYILAS